MGKRKLNLALYAALVVVICVINVLLRVFVLKDGGSGSSILSIATVAAVLVLYYVCSKPTDNGEE